MPRTNGGIIGKRNITSFGKDTVTATTSTGCLTLQSGTRLVKAAVVAGGGGGGKERSGGGGAGGLRNLSGDFNASGSVPITIGAGGAAGPNPSGVGGSNGSNSNIVLDGTTYTSTGGGGGGTGQNPSVAGSAGGSGTVIIRYQYQ